MSSRGPTWVGARGVKERKRYPYQSILIASCAALLSACATKQGAWNEYPSTDPNNVFPQETNTASGGAWDYGSVDSIAYIALERCKKAGGSNCRIVEIDGGAPADVFTWPVLGSRRNLYRYAPKPKAYAQADNGAFGYSFSAASDNEAIELALNECAKVSNGSRCRIVYINDQSH